VVFRQRTGARLPGPRVRPGARLPGHTPLRVGPRPPGSVPVRYTGAPGATRCVTTGAYSAIASAPGPRNHSSTPFCRLREVNCPLSGLRFSSTGERIRRPCGEFELSRRRQPERNRIRRTIPHRAAPGPDPARNRWSHEVRNPRPASLPRRREHPKQTTLELKR